MAIDGKRVAQNREGQSSLLTRFTNAHTLAQLHEVNHMVQDGDLRKAQAPGSSYKALTLSQTLLTWKPTAMTRCSVEGDL
jgi:hypothetical protein